MFSLADLTTPVTKDQVLTSLYSGLNTVGVDTTSWKAGSPVRTLLTLTAIFLSAFSELMAAIAKSGFLELSSGQWLTLVARYVYGEERMTATFAAGEITLTNTGGGAYAGDAGDLVFSNPDTGKTYRNTEAYVLDPLGTTTVGIVADEAGSDSTSGATTISELVTTLLGVTCSNAAAVVGQDEETDPLLRTRCYEKLGALSPNGPWDAYSYAARTATRQDGSAIGVTRVRVTRDGYGNVNTYVATASGAVSGTEGDPTTDLGAVASAIDQNSVPLAVTSNVASAAPVTVGVLYAIQMYNNSGLTETQVKDMIAARLATFMSTQPIGGNRPAGTGYVYQDAIRTVIGATLPQIFHAVVALPAGDTVIAINEVPVLGTVIGGVAMVAPPDGGL
jgi:hypothetical protein